MNQTMTMSEARGHVAEMLRDCAAAHDLLRKRAHWVPSGGKRARRQATRIFEDTLAPAAVAKLTGGGKDMVVWLYLTATDANQIQVVSLIKDKGEYDYPTLPIIFTRHCLERIFQYFQVRSRPDPNLATLLQVATRILSEVMELEDGASVTQYIVDADSKEVLGELCGKTDRGVVYFTTWIGARSFSPAKVEALARDYLKQEKDHGN